MVKKNKSKFSKWFTKITSNTGFPYSSGENTKDLKMW